MTTFIQAQVSPRILQYSNLLFNNSPRQILYELLQNSRRAGATEVRISIEDQGVSVYDNGFGISDFQDLLTLGDTQWSQETQEREDPAGMGFFSLAAYHSVISSHGRTLRLNPDVFLGKESAEVTPDPLGYLEGTLIRFHPPEKLLPTFEYEIGNIGKYYPVKLTLNGKRVAQEDFLKDCVVVDEVSFPGVRIGLAERVRYDLSQAPFNFFGLRLGYERYTQDLVLHQRLGAAPVYSLFDVTDTTALKLTLPARDKIVQNEALERLKTAFRKTAYTYLAKTGHHLAFREFTRAREMGVEMPEALPQLQTFQMDIPEPSSYTGSAEKEILPVAAGMLVVETGSIPFDEEHLDIWRHTAAPGAPVLLDAVTDFEGYTWYDKLNRVIVTDISRPAGQADIVDFIRMKVRITGPDLDWEQTWDLPAMIDDLDHIWINRQLKDSLDPDTITDWIATATYTGLDNYTEEADEEFNEHHSEVAGTIRYLLGPPKPPVDYDKQLDSNVIGSIRTYERYTGRTVSEVVARKDEQGVWKLSIIQ